MKVRPKIEDHDFGFKVRNARKFLLARDKVKFTCLFRGRELSHQELGAALLEKIVEDLSDVAFVETMPSMEGRAMVMVMAPRKDVKPQRTKDKASSAAAGGKSGEPRRNKVAREDNEGVETATPEET